MLDESSSMVDLRSEESEKCTIAGPEQLLENILPVTAARFWNGEEEKE